MSPWRRPSPDVLIESPTLGCSNNGQAFGGGGDQAKVGCRGLKGRRWRALLVTRWRAGGRFLRCAVFSVTLDSCSLCAFVFEGRLRNKVWLPAGVFHGLLCVRSRVADAWLKPRFAVRTLFRLCGAGKSKIVLLFSSPKQMSDPSTYLSISSYVV